MFEPYQIITLPAFQNNYLWLLHDAQSAVLVDPGDASICIAALKENNLQLDAVLVTHHHNDHTGGLAQIQQQFNCPIYGPDDLRIPYITHKLKERDVVNWKSHVFQIWRTPGHTNSHIVYWNSLAAHLFCGDILFGAGCGRNMEGDVSDLFHSLQRISKLPENTQIFCAHEYTQVNLDFAQTVEPDNKPIAERIQQTAHLLKAGQPTIPTKLDIEIATNPFLRSHLESIRKKLDRISLQPEIQAFIQPFHFQSKDEYYFAIMRGWKNIH